MGVDYYCCEKCEECLHSDYFKQCKLCDYESNECKFCNSQTNMFCDNKVYICDDCICNFNKGEYDISDDELNEEILKRQKSDFSKEANISKYENTIKQLKSEISYYRCKIKNLKKNIIKSN